MLIYLMALIVVIIDQVTKILVAQLMDLNQSIPLIRNVFHLTYVQNYGAAFGILAHRISIFIFIAIAVVIVIVLFARETTPRQKILRFALALQLGGALGNLIDRIRLGYVIDFLDLRIWPIFNVADLAIVAGIMLLLYDLLRNPQEKGI